VVLLSAAFCLIGSSAQALIVGPYSLDASTLHLWHLNETTVPALDSAPGGTNLTALGGSATLGAAAYDGFGTALSTATTSGDYLAVRTLAADTSDNTLMTYDDPATGAFTYEAMTRVDFNPATFNRGNVPLYLICAENEAGDRPFQFRIHTNGVAGSGVLILQFFNLTGVGNTPFIATIPTNGLDAILQGNWYHVAVTFDGAAAGGHLKFYWTRMDSDRVQANLIASATMANLAPLVTTTGVDFSLGNVGRNTPNGNFVGLIDEVRMSRIARPPTDMMFNTTNPIAPVSIYTQPASRTNAVGSPASLSVVVFGTEPLAYQWRFNSPLISGATQSTYTITSAQLTNAGDYCVVVTNSISAVTSAVATLAVILPQPVSLDTQPISQAVTVSEPASFSVTASGTPPVGYQWRFNGAPIAGASQAVWGTPAAQFADAGSYDVVVTNSVNALTSAMAVLVVSEPQPVSLHLAPTGASFQVSWPASPTAWVLQSASNLSPVIQWQPVTNAAAIIGSDNTVTLPRLGPQRFFRLLSLTQPIDWSGFTAGLPSDTNAQRVTAILRNACKYAMTTWWTNKYASQDAVYYLDLGGTDETHIRSPAMEAYGLAVALQTGSYDPVLTGVSVADARKRTLKMVRSLGYRHLVNQASGWGNDWQSALWSGLAGTAGWMLWTNLTPTDQEYVRRMVEYEANRFTNYAVPYYMNRSGTIVYPGDTKCEENAWNSSVLHLALCMMPAHPNAASWWNKALELSLSAYARPSDITRTNVFHGRTLAAWLNGSNANEDSTVINHSIVHPDYMVAGLCEFQPALVYLLVRKPVPQAGFFNLDQTYRALVDLNFAVGAAPYPTGLTNRSPGGYLYARDASNQATANIYYPNGNDWGTLRRMHFATMDATVHAFGLDGLASLSGDLWEAQHDQAVLDMQARFTDGRTYGASTEDTYTLREEWVCCYCAKCFLTKWLVYQGPIRISNDPF
jgi:hypothetical protein